MNVVQVARCSSAIELCTIRISQIANFALPPGVQPMMCTCRIFIDEQNLVGIDAVLLCSRRLGIHMVHLHLRENVTSSLNRKCVTCRNAERGGPSRGRAGKMTENLVKYRRDMRTDRQTNRHSAAQLRTVSRGRGEVGLS